MRILRTEFDRHYYSGWPYRRREKLRNRRRVRELLLHGHAGNLLEIGCGEGHLLREAMPFFNAKGIDISEFAVDKARRSLGNRAVVSNVEEAELRPGHYHIIAAFNVLEHTERPREAIRRIFAALCKEGVFIGSVPNNYGIVGGLSTLVNNLVDQTHCSTYAPQAWREHFASVGFVEITFFGEISAWDWHYVRAPLWKHVSQNLMFVCTK